MILLRLASRWTVAPPFSGQAGISCPKLTIPPYPSDVTTTLKYFRSLADPCCFFEIPFVFKEVMSLGQDPPPTVLFSDSIPASRFFLRLHFGGKAPPPMMISCPGSSLKNLRAKCFFSQPTPPPCPCRTEVPLLSVLPFRGPIFCEERSLYLALFPLFFFPFYKAFPRSQAFP